MEHPRLVFLLDVDNTLLDNDGVKADLDGQIGRLVGAEAEQAFWELYEAVRQERDVVDFPATLVRFHERFPQSDQSYEQLSNLLNTYRFDRRLFPHAIETIHHLRSFGVAVVVSDGDPTFQPRKIAEAGITEAVDGNVEIFVHKERSIAEVMARYDAGRYVMVDDKRRILAALKRDHPGRFTTVHVLQGHYAQDDADLLPPPDITVEHIADLRRCSAADFLKAGG